VRLNILGMKEFMCSHIIHVSIMNYVSCVKILKTKKQLFIHFETRGFLPIFCILWRFLLGIAFLRRKIYFICKSNETCSKTRFVKEHIAIWQLCFCPYFKKPPSCTPKGLFLVLNITGEMTYILYCFKNVYSIKLIVVFHV
jgi:hypothetical protein